MEKREKTVLEILQNKAEHNPDEYEAMSLDITDVSREVAQAASEVSCSLDIPLRYEIRTGEQASAKPQVLFDKKKYAKKADMLNSFGVVFGFEMDFLRAAGDSLRLFCDRLDFVLNLYPNHLFFPQLDVENPADSVPKPSSTFNTIDTKKARDIAFAATVFYSYGRAVPWFLAALKPLKMSPAAFLADFAEWQIVDNCAFGRFDAPRAVHKEIEKMQLVFLRQKYEEKHKEHLFSALEDMVKLNGAFSRVIAEDEECVIETTYNPDDVLSPEGMDLAHFVESTVMQHCSVAVFAGEDGPDYLIL